MSQSADERVPVEVMQAEIDRDMSAFDEFPTPAAVARVERKHLPTGPTAIELCPTTIDVTTEAGRAKLANAMCSPDRDIRDCIGEIAEVTDYLVHWSEWQEETGERKEGLRTVLFLSNGEVWAGYSDVLPGRMCHVAATVYGNRTWNPPVVMAFRERQSKKDARRRYHDVQFLAREELPLT